MKQQYTLQKKFLRDMDIRVRRVYISGPPGTSPPIAFADPPGLRFMDRVISHHILIADAVRNRFCCRRVASPRIMHPDAVLALLLLLSLLLWLFAADKFIIHTLSESASLQ